MPSATPFGLQCPGDLLVHEKIASIFLPLVGQDLKDRGVELRGCRETKAILPWVREATERTGTEYLESGFSCESGGQYR